MANSIATATNYLPFVDELYSRASTSSVLENNELVGGFVGAKTVQILDVATQYLGDYGRNSGYVDGDITATWEAHTLTQDRGRRFVLDVMDNEETKGQALGAAMNRFMRNGVVPEVDAYRYAVLASKAANSAEADLTASTIVPAIDTGMTTMEEANVSLEGGFLFVTPTKLKEIENSAKFVRNVNNGDSSYDFRIQGFYDGLRVVKVPQSRFYTAISQNDGSTAGQEAGGYAKDAAGKNINFMIVATGAVFPVTKHRVNEMISARDNQTADGDIVKYRLYHDIFVPKNKTEGIYLHNATA